MRHDVVAIGVVIGILGFVGLIIGIDGASQYETSGGEVKSVFDPDAQAEHDMYLAMQSIGIIVILIGGIIFIVGSIISTSPRHQQFMQQYQAYQIPYQSPFVFQTVNVYFCPDCRNAVEYIDQYQKYYCHNCNDYPFDKTKKKITPPPIEDDEVVDLEFDDQY